MALIKCPECATPVSDSALSCVKCGLLLRKKQRSLFGKLVKWIFILFNFLMIYWLIAGVGGAAEATAELGSDAEQAGAAIGTGIGAMFVMIIWGFGDLVLGLFLLLTRPK